MTVDRYVVIGNPVSHSKSPLIHRWFAEQTGQSLEYGAMLVEVGKFAEVVPRFFAEGGKGANVTVPFKLDAFDLAVEKTPEAETAGAVNTLYLNDEQAICGHNTDGVGLVADILNNHGGTLAGKHILILGAGGATRGILHPFLKEKPASLCIANRTVAKATALADAFRDLAREFGVKEISGCGFDDLGGRQVDWLVNATSASLEGDVPPVPMELVSGDCWCYDLMYSAEPTAFCRWAQAAGATRIMDGLGMLVEQAAESFLLWRGVRPDTRPVLERLRQK